MQNSKDFKKKYHNLYNFTHINTNEDFVPYQNEGYIVSYKFKDSIIKEIDEIIEEDKYKDFKINKYENEKIPMLIAANSVFKDKNKKLLAENKNLSEKNKSNNELIIKLAKYINEIDKTKIWCVKTECNNKCYECIIESLKK